MFWVLDASLAGLSRAERGVLAAAYNVANLNTEGFRARRPDGSPRRPDAGAPAAVKPDDSRASDVDLAEELVELKHHAVACRASAAVVRSAHGTLGAWLDLLP